LPRGISISPPPLHALTALRFFAAACIVIFHLSGTYGVPRQIGVALPQGVSFFFVLSGFVLFYNYPSLATASARQEFLLRRFARLWPGYAASLALAVFVELIVLKGAAHTSWPTFTLSFAENLAMVQTWLPIHPLDASINGPGWSISAEFGLYIAFLFLIAGFERAWWWKLAATLLIAAVLIGIATMAGLTWSAPSQSSDSEGLLYHFPPARLFEFTLGMCAALAFRRFGGKLGGGTLGWTLAEVAAIALVIVEMRLAAVVVPSSPIGWWVNQVSMAPAGASLLFVMAQGRGALSAALSVRPLLLLGDLSYAIYLLHFPLLRLYFVATTRIPVPDEVKLAGYVVVVLVASALVSLLIERPMRARIIRWDPRRFSLHRRSPRPSV
jgi:peptidoglycan/LPS O-acetylase OafA/YrhL